jgi:hypothetical protein
MQSERRQTEALEENLRLEKCDPKLGRLAISQDPILATLLARSATPGKIVRNKDAEIIRQPARKAAELVAAAAFVECASDASILLSRIS